MLRLLDAKGSVLSEATTRRGWARTPGSNGRRRQTESSRSRSPIFTLVAVRHSDTCSLAEAASPDFSVTCDPDMINVGPGGRVPLFVRLARRQGFAGAVTLDWKSFRPASRQPAGRSPRP